jgi:hypothetical protein
MEPFPQVVGLLAVLVVASDLLVALLCVRSRLQCQSHLAQLVGSLLLQLFQSQKLTVPVDLLQARRRRLAFSAPLTCPAQLKLPLSTALQLCRISCILLFC